MIHRHQRRTLPTRSDVSGTKIENDPYSEHFRKLVAVADLHGQFLFGTVQNCLPMETNDIDVAARQLVRSQEIFHRSGMRACHQLLGVSKLAGTRVALGNRDSVGERLPQQIPLAVGIGAITGRAECTDTLTVSLNQRDVDPIEGRAAHQPDRLQQRLTSGQKCPHLRVFPVQAMQTLPNTLG